MAVFFDFFSEMSALKKVDVCSMLLRGVTWTFSCTSANVDMCEWYPVIQIYSLGLWKSSDVQLLHEYFKIIPGCKFP